MKILKENKVIIGIFFLFVIISITNFIGVSFLFLNKNTKASESNLLPALEVQQVEESSQEEFYVEVKGEVKKPGVFKVKEGTIINEVIKKAGGFTKNAYTKNINLSKKLSPELVVYIYSKSEFKTKKTSNVTTNNECLSNTHEIDNCTDKKVSIIESTNNQDKQDSQNINESESNNAGNEPNKAETPTKININTADIKELSSLTGIGEKKAQAIIEYRNTNGKFKTIDEIKNISGIGEATFAKFKDSITV